MHTIYQTLLGLLVCLKIARWCNCINRRRYLFLFAGVWSIGILYWTQPLFVEILWKGFCPLLESIVGGLYFMMYPLDMQHKPSGSCYNHLESHFHWFPMFMLLPLVQDTFFRITETLFGDSVIEEKEEKKIHNIKLVGEILILLSQLEETESLDLLVNKDLETILENLKKAKSVSINDKQL